MYLCNAVHTKTSVYYMKPDLSLFFNGFYNEGNKL